MTTNFGLMLATAFLKEHGVRPAEVVESKHLSAAMEFIKARQRDRIEGSVARPSTTLRKARLLRAGPPRRTSPGSPSVAGP